jgi:AcrR family transcriptional regulator
VAPPIRTHRERWIEAGMTALARGGPDAVRVEALAATLGVTKGGFYGTFGDRNAFLTELLDVWESRSIDDTLARVEARGGTAAERILRAGHLTLSGELLSVDLAVRDWARRDPAVAARVWRVDDRRLAYLRLLFATMFDDPHEVEARSTLALALAVGQHFIAGQQDGRSRSASMRRAAKLLVTPIGQSSAGS